ncbi:MAG: monofunctional biosynthetic peptidoglycan transglycosylase [Bacteroidales bacterium]
MVQAVSVKKKWYKPLAKLALRGTVAFFISTILLTVLFSFINPNLTMLMVIKRHQSMLQNTRENIRKDWVSIDNISPQVVLAVCAAEDNKFMEHNGFDWEAIQKAMKSNKKGKKLKGASTISQQTAKNLFLWPKRSWFRKGLETYFTFLIETCWSKKRIMEVYLNVIEFGRGIYGVEKASQIYFKKPAKQLNRYESALLATVLPFPAKRNPSKPSSYMLRYQKTILRNMGNLGTIDLDTADLPSQVNKKHK